MNLKRSLVLALPAFSFLMVSALAQGEPPAPSATASNGSPVESAAPTATAKPAKPPPPPTVRGADIPTDRSTLPKKAEWADAKDVTIDGNTSCKARLLREWLSVECTDLYGAGLVAGDPKDVRITASGDPMEWIQATQTMGHSLVAVVLPIQRGKAHIVGFLDLSGSSGNDYGPAMAGEGQMLHVWWRDGDTDPSLEMISPIGR
jgi:hypothetical protein